MQEREFIVEKPTGPEFLYSSLLEDRSVKKGKVSGPGTKRSAEPRPLLLRPPKTLDIDFDDDMFSSSQQIRKLKDGEEPHVAIQPPPRRPNADAQGTGGGGCGLPKHRAPAVKPTRRRSSMPPRRKSAALDAAKLPLQPLDAHANAQQAFPTPGAPLPTSARTAHATRIHPGKVRVQSICECSSS